MTAIESRTMGRDEAERLTERIRLTATTFMETRDKLAALIREAQEGRAHEALGFPSWTAYVSAVCSDTPLMRLSHDERRVIVADLAEQGMSTRAIAPVVGVDQKTISNDMRAMPREESSSPVPAPTFDPTPAWDPTTGEVIDDPPEPSPRTVTGLDGKTYQRPANDTRPRRRPLYETASRDLMTLRDATEKIASHLNDDRYPANAEELAPMLRNQLTYVIETCQGYLDHLDQPTNN